MESKKVDALMSNDGKFLSKVLIFVATLQGIANKGTPK